MRTTAKLIRKEKLRSNYKLTFAKGNNVFFLILHERQTKIYHWLKASRNYSFWYERGYKYSFVRKIELTKHTTAVKDTFISELSEKLKITKKPDSLFGGVKQFIQTLYLKHENNLNTPFLLLSEQDRKEIQILNELRTLFFIDYIY